MDHECLCSMISWRFVFTVALPMIDSHYFNCALISRMTVLCHSSVHLSLCKCVCVYVMQVTWRRYQLWLFNTMAGCWLVPVLHLTPPLVRSEYGGCPPGSVARWETATLYSCRFLHETAVLIFQSFQDS